MVQTSCQGLPWSRHGLTHRADRALRGTGGQHVLSPKPRGAAGLAGGKQLETGNTALLGESVIHAVANPLRVFTGAIHHYGESDDARYTAIGEMSSGCPTRPSGTIASSLPRWI